MAPSAPLRPAQAAGAPLFSGEANPGGGKSEVERYLAKSRAEVVESAEILKTVIDILGIPGATQ
eukprot:scaffold2129_cov107-Isochrysis_galbana.AAC.7